MIKMKLSELATVVMGQSPKGDTCNTDNIGKPLLNGPTEFGSFFPIAKQFTTTGNKLSIKEDILFCVRGSTTGRMNISDKEYVLGRGLAAIRHKLGVEYNTYLRYLIEYNLSSILRVTSGSTFPNLTASNLLGFKFLVSEPINQLRISNFLSNLDAKIELNNKINQELEAMAKTLYDYWFVQFDFPAYLSGTLSGVEGYKSSGGKMVYNEELKREIPEGWILKDLNDIEFNIITGKTPSTKVKENFGGDIPFITINDIRQDIFIFKADRTLSELGAQTQKNKFIYENDICVSCIGTVGVIGFAGRSAHTNQQINTISKPKSYNRYYLYQYLNDYFEFNNAAKKGAVLSNMNKGEFESIPVLDAPIKLKEAYFKTIDSSFKKISNNIKQNHKLAELRDWLLPMLMNGQVTVGEGYAAQEEVLGMVAEEGATYGKEQNKR